MTWNKGLSLLLQSWSVNATRNNDSRSPEARAQGALLYFVTQISWGQWYVTSVALNTPYFIRSTQATRVNTYLCTYPCIALLDTTYIHKDKTNFTLIFQLLQPPSTHRLFLFHSSLLPSSFSQPFSFEYVSLLECFIHIFYHLTTKIAFPTSVSRKRLHLTFFHMLFILSLIIIYLFLMQKLTLLLPTAFWQLLRLRA